MIRCKLEKWLLIIFKQISWTRHADLVIVSSLRSCRPFIYCVHTIHPFPLHLVLFYTSPRNPVTILIVSSPPFFSSRQLPCLLRFVLSFSLGHRLFLTRSLLILVLFLSLFKSYYFFIHTTFIFLLSWLSPPHFYAFLTYNFHFFRTFLSSSDSLLFVLTDAVTCLSCCNSVQCFPVSVKVRLFSTSICTAWCLVPGC